MILLSDTQTENKEANEEIKTNNANAPTQSINTSIEDVIITDAKVTTEGANISQAEDEQLDKETVPFESDTMHLKDSKLQESIKTSAEDSVIADTKVPTEGSGISRSEDEQVDKETLLMESKSMHIEDSKQQDESKEIDKILTEQSKSLQLEDEESDKITSTIKPATEQVKEGKLENESSELDSYVPEVAKEEQEKYEPSANERSESLEKVLSTSQEIKSPCETFDSHRNSEEGVENLSQSNDGVMSMIDTANAVLESSEKIETALPDEEANKILESDSIVEHTINTTKEVGNEESLDQTKSEPGLEKKEPDEDHIVALEDDSPRPATKSGISDTLHVEQKDDSTDLIKNSPDVAEDTITEESKPKRESPSAPNPDKKSSLLVTNQLIGTQNLPTNHIEIEKNTKKLTSPSVKDKDIGTLTSGRLVPTPIAELQLKSFKTPNDDGAWYDIYVEPKMTSDQDTGNNSVPVQATKTEADQPASSGVEEPTTIAERVASYYTPQEIVETVVPKAKNSVSFFVSFDSDDGKPKYKIPKKFRDPSKIETKEDVAQLEYDFDSNEEEIEVIEVSEGDPEYQQTGGTKLQTILELDNENEQSPESTNQNSALEPETVDSSEENTNKIESNSGKAEVENKTEESDEKLLTKSTKRETEHFESAYKTDIINITRSIQIIERAYSRLKSKRFLKSEQDNKLDLERQNEAAKIIQKWIRDSLMKKSLGDSQKSKESLAAKKIQRAYRKYVGKTTERETETEKLNKIKKEDSAALVIQKAFRKYFQRNNTERNKLQPSDKLEFEQNQAAGKIQRAYRRYLKLSDKPAMTNELQPQELQEDLNSDDETSKLKLSNEQETSCKQQSVELQNMEKPLSASLSLNQIMKELKTEDQHDLENVMKTISNQIELSNCTDQPKVIKELKDELSYEEPEIINEVQSEELKETENLSEASSSPIYTPKLVDNPEIIKELKAVELEAQMPTKDNLAQKLEDQPKEMKELMSDEIIVIKHSLEDSSCPIHLPQSSDELEMISKLQSEDLKSTESPSEASLSPTHTPKLVDNPEITKELKVDELEKENAAKVDSTLKLADQPNEIKELMSLRDSLSSISLSKSSDESAIIAELVAEELQAIENPAEDGSSLKSANNPEITKDLQEELFQKLENSAEAYLTPIQDTPEIRIEVQSNELSSQEKPEIIIELHSDGLQGVETPVETISSSISSSNDELDGEASAALVIQRAFRQYMERKKLENFDESSFDSITSSRITAIETSNYPTAVTPVESLVHEANDEPGEDAPRISQKSEWFVGTTRIVPSQGVVEEHRGVETDPDPAAITRKTELNTSTQVESVKTVDRMHGSLESKLTPGISSSKIDESSRGSASEKDNAVSSGLAGLTESSEAGLGSVEDPLLQSQSDFGGIVQSLDIASTQELVNNFLENEIEYSSRQRPFQPDEVIEEPCVKKSASLVNLLSEGESEPETVSQKAENTDSSVSETTGLETLSADTIDKATVKLSKPEEVIEKMSQMKESKSQDRLPSAAPSFDEPVVRPMSSLQEQYSLDIEDGDIIVYNRLQREETRESSAQSDSVVFGEAEAETIQLNEEESGRGHLMRHYTIAGDDPRGLFRSVTIDDALSYVEIGEKDMAINSSNSFCLDDETSENIRKKMMAYSLSETDSDYFDPRKTSTEDFDIDTAMADAMGTSTETESTIVSAATKIQAGARGFLTRRRLRRASAGTKSSTLDTKASFGNDAISESLERFIEEEAAKKIQAAYRMHTRKRKGHSRKMEGISLESNLAARRQKLQRGDALRNDSTPDDENSSSTSGGQAPKSSKIVKSKTVGDSKSKPDMELKWLKMRQNSMPVQIDCEVFRVIPKHMRKRIKSAEANKRK
ncbi:protein P200 isoform X4 [Drosophila elegans]|uniref:protein P200 isoform X4 n=1 Tax=Drosophila elegans TaxID=30023 RepID=UPI0007E61B9B|nr:protein P200 isoform X4 [Drosophila elegans]